MEKRVLTQNLLLCALITALGALASSLSSVLDRMAASVGLAPERVGVFISVYMVGSCLSAFFGGSLADRLGKRRVIAAGGNQKGGQAPRLRLQPAQTVLGGAGAILGWRRARAHALL